MNDNDIIKALECCFVKCDCADCPKDGRRKINEDCLGTLGGQAIDLIARLKAEIERLQHIRAELSKENEEQDRAIINALHRMKVVRAEAFKEFAESVKKEPPCDSLRDL